MPRPVALALVVASRFGVLAALAVWLGLALAALLLLPVLFKQLERPQAFAAAAAILRRVDRVLFVAIAVLALALSARIALDGAAPPTGLVLPLAVMLGSRLVGGLAVGPALRALRDRLGNASAVATEAERAAFGRLYGASVLLLTLEACLGLYALYAVS